MKRTAEGIDRTAGSVVQILPAHGYKALYNGPEGTVTTAVLGWGLDTDGGMKPLVIGFDGELVNAYSVRGFYAIVQPGGDNPDDDAWFAHIAAMDDDVALAIVGGH